MKVEILAGSVSKFGELWDVSPRDLVKQVVSEALSETKLKIREIEAVYVGNMLSSSLGGQDHLGAFFSEVLGLNVPAMKVEGACASGGLAVHAGVLSVISGLYKNVLVVGIEKMTDHKPEEAAKALMGAGSDEEREAGATFPGLYAMMARSYMKKYGLTEEDLAHIAVKNHYHASLNSHAQFSFPVTIEQVMKSSVVASPLKLLDCSPITDGAAAVILSNYKKNKSVSIIASAAATDTLGIAGRDDLTSLKSTVLAAKKAYQQAGVAPSQIDVAEVHDCFTIAEIIAMDDLGFFPRGKSAEFIRRKKTTLGYGHPVVNTSGGLKAAGHPVGATGVKQIVEIYRQLKGVAGKKQVKNAKTGLTHNVGGSGATAVIHILQKD